MATTTIQSISEFKPKANFERLFDWIPTVLNEMKYPNIPMNSDKLFRLEFLRTIYNGGLEKYYKTITEETPDYYAHSKSEKIYLVDFETESELREWVISGMSKKDQNEFFNTEEEESLDSVS